MLSSKEFEEGLRQFYGTEKYYKIGNTPIVATDGVMWFANQTESHWLISEIVETYLYNMDTESFVLVQMKSNGESADITYFNGDDEKVHESHYDDSNLPIGLWRFYIKDGVILLPQEY